MPFPGDSDQKGTAEGPMPRSSRWRRFASSLARVPTASMGLQCAFCHSTVDNSLAPGIGHRLDGWANRDLNVGASALAYAGLLVATLRYLSGALSHAAKPHDWTAGLLAKPFGMWLLGIIGLCWIAGAGIGEIARGWRGSFADDLELERRAPTERRWAMGLGRFGIVARGVVFTVIGPLVQGVTRAISPAS
jgi:hypothetical protein